MTNFSNFQKLSKKKKKEHILKDSKENIVGVIDDDNNLLIINPNYKLQVSGIIQSNRSELTIKNSNEYGIKLDKSSLKIITPQGEKLINETHTHDYELLNNLPENTPQYTDIEARRACNGKINSIDSKTLNGHYVDNDKMLWDGKKLVSKFDEKANKSHIHDAKEIKNLPVSISKEEVNGLIEESSNNILNKTVKYYNDSTLKILESKSDVNHAHNIDKYSQYEVNELLDQKANKNHNHNFPRYTDQDVHRVVDSVIGKKLVHPESVRKQLSKKSNIDHLHNEKEISDLDKYKKKEIDKFLNTKSDKSHKHSLKEITGKDKLYSDQDTQKVIEKYINDEVLLIQDKIYDLLNEKADLNHNHKLIDIDEILLQIKDKIKKFLEHNITASNSDKLQDYKAQDFAGVNHTHNFKNLKDTKHKHSESDIDGLDKFTREEVNGFLVNKANTSHSHHINQIKNFPKLYSDTDTNRFIQNKLINDGMSESNLLYSSEKVEGLVNNRARVNHEHKLSDIKEVKGYIERTVEIAVKNNVSNHKHSMFDITDKPTFYNDSQARNAIGGQVNDRGSSDVDIWSARKVQNELEYLKRLIDSK